MFQVTLWLLLLYLTSLAAGKCQGNASDLILVLNNWPLTVIPNCEGNSVDVQLYSNLPQARLVCPGEPLTFTCMTVGSPLLAWSSSHYISESGTQLSFSKEDMMGTTKLSPNDASVGNLTKVNSSDPIILESTLHFNVSDQYSTSQIICINSANDLSTTINFNIGKRM